jgi:prevent-host-death family protein
MRVDTRDIISVSDANQMGVSKLVREASEGRPKVVLTNGKPTAAVVSIETMERLERLEESEENLRLLAVTVARVLVDDGTRHDLDDVARELGIDPDELEEG